MIGNAIRIVRERCGLEGRQMADSIGISPSYLSRIENNKRNPSPAILSAIDMVAAQHKVPSNLVGLSDVNDPTARMVHGFLSREDISSLRKASVRALIEAAMKVE